MFKQNKYTNYYYNIINNATQNTDVYGEEHHIIPKSLGGSNKRENLVRLTAREHFICHWLLIYMVDSKLKYKMQFAFFKMFSESDNQKRYAPSRHYEKAKLHNLEAIRFRKTTKGYKMSDEAKEKMSKAKKGKMVFRDPETNERFWANVEQEQEMLNKGLIRGSGLDVKGKKNPRFGIVMSNETKQKISKARTGQSIVYVGKELERRKQFCADRNKDPKFIKLSSERRSKEYVVTNPNGDEILIKNLSQFCKDNNLHTGNMTSVAKGKLRQYKGWTCRYVN